MVRTRSGPEAGQSAVVTRTVRACVESVMVSRFLRDLLAKSAGLIRKATYNGSKPPTLYR
jgi:hypothetical protein